MDVGWVGLGAMGLPMARCLVSAGHAVRAFDVSPDRLVDFAPSGAALTPGDAASRASVVFVMVASPGQLAEALFGPEGVATGIGPGSVVVITATVGVEAVEEAARRLEEVGVRVVDAPVSGGVARAANGDLLFLVSGPSDAVSTARPLLDVMARHVAEFGGRVGDGQRVKLVNQLLCGVHIAAAAEALAFSEALGLDAENCWNAVRTGAAASFMLDDRGQRMVTGSFEDVRSALDIFVKDLGLVTDEAGAHGFRAPLASAARDEFVRGHELGFGRQDDSIMIEVMRRG